MHYIISEIYSGVTGGGRAECPPRDFWPGNFCWRIGKKEARKKMEKGENWEEERRKIVKGRWKIGRGSNKKLWKEVRTFFFFAFHFWKRRKFVLGLPKWEFPTGKKHFTPGKNQEKWLCPLRKIYQLRPWRYTNCFNNCNFAIIS